MDKGNENNNQSVAGGVNGAIGMARNIRGAGKMAKTLITAARGAGVFAFNPAGSVVLAFAFVFIATAVIVFLFGGAPTAVGGDLGNNPPPNGNANSSPGPDFSPGPDQSPLPPADLAEINKHINIGYKDNGGCYAYDGNACAGSNYKGLHLTDSEKNFIYNIFKNLLRSQGYKNLIGNKLINIYIFEPIHPGFIDGGGGYNQNDIAFFGYFRNGVDDKYKRQIMIHESAHILDKRNGSNELGMNLADLYNRDGGACYDERFPKPYYLKTYAFRGKEGDNGGARSESFAEAVADNVICTSGYPCTTGAGHAVQIDYPSACPQTKAWIKHNVFGDVDVSQ